MKQQINLLPPELRAEKTLNLRQFMPMITAVIVIIATFSFGFYLFFSKSNLEGELKQLKAEKQKLTLLQKQLEDERSVVIEIKEQIAILEEISLDQVSWYYLLQEIYASLPEGIWLEQISGDGNKLQIRGNTVEIIDVGILLIELNNLPSLKKVTLVKAEKTDLQGQQITVFELLGHFK